MKKKKGMFFSLITILMVLIIIISFKLATEESIEESKIASTQLRIKMLNDFINDLETNYFENMLEVAAKTALQALSNYTVKNTLKTTINEDNTKPGAFETVMLFGYLKDPYGQNCEDSLCKEYSSKLSDAQFVRYRNYQFRKIDKDLPKPIMLNYAFFDLLNKTETTLENLGVRTDSFSIKIDDLIHKDNWNLNFKATIDYHFVDKYEIASWRGRTEKEFDISIYGYTDPLSGKTIDDSWKECKGAGCIDFPSFLNRLKSGTDDDNTKGICQFNEICDIAT